jgi:uncharacterized protein (TIGR03437 family)
MSAGVLAAQVPYINYRGVVNAASYAPQGIPAGSIARGSIFTIFGRNLGPDTFVTASSYPLADALGGVSIEISQGGVLRAAIPIFVWNFQVSAVMPSNAPLGKVVLRLTRNGQRSNPAHVNVVESSAGLFAVNRAGLGPGVAQNVVSATELPINSTNLSARPGQTLILWGTGLGPVPHADNVAPAAAESASEVEIYVGGKPAARRYAGRSPCCAGLDQIVFDVPQDAPTGCYVPVLVRTNRATVSNSVTVAIEAAGRPCTDPANPVAAAFRAGGRIALAIPERKEVQVEEAAGEVVAFTNDKFYALLRDVPSDGSYFGAATSLPPIGTCTTYSGPASLNIHGPFRVLPGKQLGAGAASRLVATEGQRRLAPSAILSFLWSSIVGKAPAVEAPPLFFRTPGSFRWVVDPLAGLGIDAQFDFNTPLQWLNRAQLTVLDRAQGLTYQWTGGDAAREVAILGGLAGHEASDSAAMFLCAAPVGAASFQVPREVLSALPATPSSVLRAVAWVYLATVRLQDPVRFPGMGVDAGFVVPTSAWVRSVTVR